MPGDKIVLLTHPSDQGDILKDYIEWHLDLGVDFIIAQDCDSTDNTQEILDEYARRGRLQWFPMPERNLIRNNSPNTLAKMAIDRPDTEWIIMSDVDEFLCTQGESLKSILKRAAQNDVTAITAPCFNMIGSPFTDGRATQKLTLRIDRPQSLTNHEWITDGPPVPYIFMQHFPKTIARASAFVEYGPGTHAVVTAWGESKEVRELHFLHYQIRGFETFQKKVANTAAFFKENEHLKYWWAWHWRRWIKLEREGRLREEYDSQFVSPARAEELVREGTCTVDETVAKWLERRERD